MAKQKTELQVIDFEKFEINQLPELKNKREDVFQKVSEFESVEITDNTSYELAKKSRTGVRAIRTELQKEQKNVDKKIKEMVLAPVKQAYDQIIADVLVIEEQRQEEVTKWEDVKEKERQEKLLLEQQRVEGIKAKIKEFGDVWGQAFSLMKYENIKECIDTFQESVEVVDVKELEEFEILFTDKVDDLRFKLDSRITLLTNQNELKLERERLAEIQEEQNRVNAIKTKIDSWEKNWLYVINNLEFRNSSVTQNEFETQTALDCQELQPVYADIRKQIQEALFIKVSKLSSQEKERVERENFLKEKADFEEKMRLEEQKKKESEELLAKSKVSDFEQKVNNRIIELVSYDLKFDFESTYTDGNFFVDLVDIKTYSDEKWDELILKISGFEEVLKKDLENIEVVIEKVFQEKVIQDVDFEETWDSIQEDYRSKQANYDSFFEYLKENYNVPTEK